MTRRENKLWRLRVEQNFEAQRTFGKFKFGDMVKVIGFTKMPHQLKIGEVGIIERIDCAGHCLVSIPIANNYSQWVHPFDLELWEE